MKRSEKYKLNIDLIKPINGQELLNTYGNIQPYRLIWWRDDELHAEAALVFITDIAPPITPEIATGIPLDVRYALNEQYGEQLRQELQNTLDIIDEKENLENIFKL
nr:hypothetical protein [uncultured Mediterranean phage uvMED]BAR26459.1 hypothetical protein [uncultured Mediterranean phage uvMED]